MELLQKTQRALSTKTKPCHSLFDNLKNQGRSVINDVLYDSDSQQHLELQNDRLCRVSELSGITFIYYKLQIAQLLTLVQVTMCS